MRLQTPKTEEIQLADLARLEPSYLNNEYKIQGALTYLLGLNEPGESAGQRKTYNQSWQCDGCTKDIGTLGRSGSPGEDHVTISTCSILLVSIHEQGRNCQN